MKPQLYANSENQKLRGGYYTPACIAEFLARWAVRDQADEILEPSCGNGVLLAASANRLRELGQIPSQICSQIQGIELYDSEVQATKQSLENLGISTPEKCLMTGDFFDYDEQAWGIIRRRFNVVIGNPPFLRYHHFPEEQRERAFRIMQTAGMHPTRLTNAWVPFLIASSLRLKANGRLAMIIPAELLQVKYAEETRQFLAKHFSSLTIVTFRRLIFKDIQQEVVLLISRKKLPRDV